MTSLLLTVIKNDWRAWGGLRYNRARSSMNKGGFRFHADRRI
ncbi:MAG: hypothetical protein U9N14_05760 [Pseudomonadota bacterium]|nr:hypothetical protein [Pseudomonadota bacterium]